MRITKDTPISELYHSDIVSSDDELMHWKYIKREKVKGKWKYYYDLDSLKKDVKKAVKDVTSKTRKLVDSGAKSIRRYTSNTARKISKSLSGTISSVKKRVFKYVAKVPTGDTYRYFYSDEAYQAYINGKKAVDKALDKKISATPSDTAKANAQSFIGQVMSQGFGKAVYNLVAPALAALQVELTTPKSFSELKKTTGEQTDAEHQKAINPDYSVFGTTYDYNYNCSFCTAAYDLRKRGYDVEANPISLVEAYTIHDVKNWYKDAKVVSEQSVLLETGVNNPSSDADRLETSLKKHGEGARGHLALYWASGGGHDVIWEIQNGDVVIRDCQTGAITNAEYYMELISSYDYIRTDNLEPTEEVLRTVRNRKTR